HTLAHLVLDEIVEIADRGHAGAFVDRLLDFRRDRNVLDNKTGKLETILRPDYGVDDWQQCLTKFRIARRNVERGNLRRRQRVRKNAHQPGPHRFGNLVYSKVLIGADNFLQKETRLHNVEVISAEGTQAQNSKVLVTHHDGIRRAPLVAREEPRVDEVD